MAEDASEISQPCPPVRLGPVKVSATQMEIDAFRLETGWQHVRGDAQNVSIPSVPHTFPMRWLSLPDTRAAIEAELKASGGIAFHESQSFAYDEPLAAEQDYLMTAEIDRQKNPDRLILSALIAKEGEAPVLRMETILRIVTAPKDAR